MYSPNLNTIMNAILEKTASDDELPFTIFPGQKARVSGNTKIKILFVSSHCHQYNSNSKVSWNILKLFSQIPNSFEVLHFGIMQADKVDANFRPYPPNITYCSVREITNDPYGLDKFRKLITDFSPDIILLFHNLEVIKKYIDSCAGFSGIVACYIDMCYFSIKSDYVLMLNNNVRQIFTTSLFWKTNLESQGVKTPIAVFEYGFDKEAFCKVDKIGARNNIKLPADSFLILNPNKNTQKHRYDILLRAFVKLVVKYPHRADIHLLCLCDKGESGGYPILEIYITELRKYTSDVKKHLGKILLVQNEQNYPDSVINMIYNCADIGVGCSDGEGGSLAALEMMGLGIPQILPDSGIYDKKFAEIFPLLPIKHVFYLTNKDSGIAGEARAVCADDLFLALEKYFLSADLVSEHGKNATFNFNDRSWQKTSAAFFEYLYTKLL